MIAAYLRVSSDLQARTNGCNSQRDAILAWLAANPIGTPRWFEDSAVSGKSMDRPAFNTMMSRVRNGSIKTVIFYDLSRAGRTLRGLAEWIEEMVALNIRVVFVKEKMDLSTPTDRLILHLLAAVAEWQRQNIIEKTTDGIHARIRSGKPWGRPSLPATCDQVRALRQAGTDWPEIAKTLGCSTRTAYRRFAKSPLDTPRSLVAMLPQALCGSAKTVF